MTNIKSCSKNLTLVEIDLFYNRYKVNIVVELIRIFVNGTLEHGEVNNASVTGIIIITENSNIANKIQKMMMVIKT